MSLCTKTAALLAAIVGVGLAAASFVWIRIEESSQKHTIFEGLDGQARVAAHGIAAFLDGGLRAAQVVALTFPTDALLDGRTRAVEEHLDRMLQAFPAFQNGIFLLDGEGSFVTDTPRHPHLRGHSFAYREYFQRTLTEQRGIVGEPYRSRRTGRPVLTFTGPVRDGTGRIVAIVACSADLLSAEALGGYRNQTFGSTGYLYLIDGSRRLVMHPEDERLLTTVDEGKNAVLDAALRGFEGAAETVNSKGVPMLLAVRRIPSTSWIVGVQVTRREAYAPLAESRVRIAWIALGAMLLVSLVGGVAIRGVSRPLNQLERAASEITVELSGGRPKEPHMPVDRALQCLRRIRPVGEIGALASSFLRLAEKLRSTLRTLQESATDWERTFDSVHDAVVTIDPDGRVLRMNRTAESWLRTVASALTGRPADAVLLGNAPPPADWPKLVALSEQQRCRWSREIDGARRVLEGTFTPLRHAEAGTAGTVVVLADITERVESEERIRELAFFDHLTGLPNRFLLHDRLQQAIASAARCEKKVAVMFIDVDRFKDVNDRHGHDIGDRALQETVRRIVRCVRRSDTVSRLGGDEFVVVLQPIDGRHEAGRTAERILATQAAPMHIGDVEIGLHASIGIALYPDDAQDGKALLNAADRAMYRAKQQGRNRFLHFAHAREDVGA